MAGKDFSGEDLEVVAAEVEHLRLGVDRVGDGDLALVLALHPSLACKSIEKRTNLRSDLIQEVLII